MDPELRRQMSLARESYQRQEYSRAEPLLRSIVAQHPMSAEMFNMLGVILHHRGSFSEAQQMLEQALHLNNSYTEAALNLAVVYNDTGRYQDAQAVYGQVLQQARSQPQQLDSYARGKLANLHAATADAYRELGLLEGAEAEYRKALTLAPQFPDLRCALAATLSEQGNHEGAVGVYQELLNDSPQYVQGFVLLGTELYALGRKAEAREAWTRALQVDPQNKRVAVYLNWVKE